jgi:hypothetical protein
MRIPRLALAAVLSLPTVVVGVITDAPPTQAQAAESLGSVYMVNSGRVGSTMCLDIPYSSSQAGLQLTQWGCTGNPNQQWYLTASTGGSFLVRSSLNNYCLDIPYSSLSAGAAVTQYPCHGGANQRFFRINNAQNTSTYVNANSNLCVDVQGYGTNWGALMTQYNCAGTDNQQQTTSAKPVFGYVDVQRASPQMMRVEGWRATPIIPNSAISGRVLYNGSPAGDIPVYNFTYRPDVGAAYPGYGNYNGFSATIPVSSLGSFVACVQAANPVGGQYYDIGNTCRTSQSGINPLIPTETPQGAPPSGYNSALCRPFQGRASYPYSIDTGFGLDSGSVTGAMAAWGGPFTPVAPNVAPVVSFTKNISTVPLFQSNWAAETGNPDGLGNTCTWTPGIGWVTQNTSIIRFNPDLWNRNARCPQAPNATALLASWCQSYRNSYVATHEVGHFLGLIDTGSPNNFNCAAPASQYTVMHWKTDLLPQPPYGTVPVACGVSGGWPFALDRAALNSAP